MAIPHAKHFLLDVISLTGEYTARLLSSCLEACINEAFLKRSSDA